MRIQDPEPIPEISCINVRMEREHKPHEHLLQLYENSAGKVRAKCWGYPRYREDGRDDKKFVPFNEGVTSLRDSPK